MLVSREIVLERVVGVVGGGVSLRELCERAAVTACMGIQPKAVLVATFSNPERFPALSVRIAASLGLDSATPAFDIQMACSAYPYALYVAGKLAADLDGPVLVVDGDVQTPLVDARDHATGQIFSDAATATLVRVGTAEGVSRFDFMSRADESLACLSGGPIHMDGFKVFSFVATEVSRFLKAALAEAGVPDVFVPHQAQPYMVRQLARTLALEDQLLVLDEAIRNPGSCSVPLVLAKATGNPERLNMLRGKRALVAGFGAGLSAAVGFVRLSETFSGVLLSSVK